MNIIYKWKKNPQVCAEINTIQTHMLKEVHLINIAGKTKIQNLHFIIIVTPDSGKNQWLLSMWVKKHQVIYIYNNWKVERAQISNDGWMDTQNVLLSTQWEVIQPERDEVLTCNNMGEPWTHYTEWQVITRSSHYTWLHLHKYSE